VVIVADGAPHGIVVVVVVVAVAVAIVHLVVDVSTSTRKMTFASARDVAAPPGIESASISSVRGSATASRSSPAVVGVVLVAVFGLVAVAMGMMWSASGRDAGLPQAAKGGRPHGREGAEIVRLTFRVGASAGDGGVSSR